MKKQTAKFGVFYRSNGRWTPYRSSFRGNPRVFVSQRELNRFVNSSDFRFEKNRVLKSKTVVRKLK